MLGLPAMLVRCRTTYGARDVSLSNRTSSSPPLAGKWLRTPVRAGGADAASRSPGGVPLVARLALELVSLERAEDAFGRSASPWSLS